MLDLISRTRECHRNLSKTFGTWCIYKGGKEATEKYDVNGQVSCSRLNLTQHSRRQVAELSMSLSYNVHYSCSEELICRAVRNSRR